jgi:hypothetical protein
MKTIQSWDQLTDLDKPFKTYLIHTKSIIPNSDAWDFSHWGYWIILDAFEELNEPIRLNHFTLPSIHDGFMDRLELIEEQFGVYELVVLWDNDFGIGILIQSTEVPQHYKTIFEEWKSPISA